jgi:hypothetical protein
LVVAAQLVLGQQLFHLPQCQRKWCQVQLNKEHPHLLQHPHLEQHRHQPLERPGLQRRREVHQ